MMRLSAFRMMSRVFARLAVRHWGGGQPTNRRQDKSRGVRLGRSAEEHGIDQRLVHEVYSPTQPAYSKISLKFSTRRTSYRSSYDRRR